MVAGGKVQTAVVSGGSKKNVKRVEVSPGPARTFEIDVDNIVKQIEAELQEWVYEVGDSGIKFDASDFEMYLRGGVKEVKR